MLHLVVAFAHVVVVVAWAGQGLVHGVVFTVERPVPESPCWMGFVSWGLFLLCVDVCRCCHGWGW